LSSPIYPIDGPWPGRLGIVSRPRGGDWLDVEIQSWKKMDLNVVVSLLIPDEVIELNLENEANVCRGQGIEFVSFGIPDREVPRSRVETVKILNRIQEWLLAGQQVALHCRQSIGRSGLMAGCLLILNGVEPEDALTRVSRARGCEVPETAEQRAWFMTFAASLKHASI
jgi:protein-tyrosine phosphatase